MIEAYPLQYPAGWSRSQTQQISKFGRYTFEQMRTEVLRELKLLGATDVIISSNLRLRQDGYPYSGQRQPEDTGIAVYFKLEGQDQCIPCDKWHRVEDNMRAIAKTIEALRGIERWGAKEMVNAAFRGFKALPEATIVTPYQARAWYEVLEVSQNAGIDVIRAAYRAKLKIVHPDVGGSSEEFMELEKAYRESGAKS